MMSNQNLYVQYRIPILVVGFICLLFGIGGGLLRLGWSLPFITITHLTFHGPLMVCGFLGTLISLERAVAIGKYWAYLGPITAALGGLFFIIGLPLPIGVTLMTIASLVMSFATAHIYIRQRALFTLTLLLGSLSWLLANVFWMIGFDISQLIPWWITFLVLTIAGERLELSRFLPSSLSSKVMFIMIITLFLIGAVIATISNNFNLQTLSVALLALSIWLLRQDVARFTIKHNGLTRYIAVCLISGYLWLLVGGLVGLCTRYLLPSSSYDAFLHSILIGFVFSMIFGHAPIILPAVARLKLTYHSIFYLPLIVLHTSLIVRVAGDLLLGPLYRRLGGMLNAIALISFALIMVGAVICSKRNKLILN
jgi:hypothetical protein